MLDQTDYDRIMAELAELELLRYAAELDMQGYTVVPPERTPIPLPPTCTLALTDFHSREWLHRHYSGRPQGKPGVGRLAA